MTEATTHRTARWRLLLVVAALATGSAAGALAAPGAASASPTDTEPTGGVSANHYNGKAPW